MNTDSKADKIFKVKKSPALIIEYLRANKEEVIKLISNGYTVVEMCECLGVKVRSFYRFLKTMDEEYVDRLREARFRPNLDVEAATFKAATGYDVVEEKLIYMPGTSGEKTKVKAVIKTTKHIPPNPTLNIYWNKNRNPKRWKDTQTIELSLDKDAAKAAILELFVGPQLTKKIEDADFIAIPERAGTETE